MFPGIRKAHLEAKFSAAILEDVFAQINYKYGRPPPVDGPRNLSPWQRRAWISDGATAGAPGGHGHSRVSFSGACGSRASPPQRHICVNFRGLHLSGSSHRLRSERGGSRSSRHSCLLCSGHAAALEPKSLKTITFAPRGGFFPAAHCMSKHVSLSS